MQANCLVRFLGQLLCAFFLLVQFAAPADAHEQVPAIVDFKLLGDDRYQFKIKTNAEALIAGIGNEHSDTDDAPNSAQYEELRKLPESKLIEAFESFKGTFQGELKIYFNEQPSVPSNITLSTQEVGDVELARESEISLTGDVPKGAQVFSWKWPEKFGASVLRVETNSNTKGEGYSAFLRAGVLSDKIPLEVLGPSSFWDVVKNYFVIGFTHILPKGLDHILFVVGLFLLSAKLKPLVWQVTAFTVAHTITIALGVLGLVRISPSIVEPLIAASIVYVAVENIFTDKLNRWRPFVIFAFGLLHGLGFAGVISEIGLSTDRFIASLISFNVGVEVGQLSVIAICFAVVGFWFGNKSWYRNVITIPTSIVIGLIGCWWFYERVFLG